VGRGGGGFGGLRRSLLGGSALGFAHIVSENRVELLRDAQLVLLQLAQTADHECVFEVAGDARFQERHVVVGELGQAVLEQTTNAAIRGLLTILNTHHTLIHSSHHAN